ncbi:MAG: Rrf2 family transcriptional regulator [bacterium]|nr:hypothetical protein [Deltaproteobacteria bacterium]MCP4904427.1 Rrf2 family transcriptional regulator [bacterium]
MHLLAREDVGLRCLLQVARCNLGAGLGGLVPIAQIAAGEGISDVYAAKLMRQLRLAGLVESTRGAAGGYRLTRRATEISVWDAIRALDESFLPEAICDCHPEDRVDCRRTTTCAVTSLWRRLGEEIRSSLEAVSLADLCEGALHRPDRIDLPVAQTTKARMDTVAPTPHGAPRAAGRPASHPAWPSDQERNPGWSISR